MAVGLALRLRWYSGFGLGDDPNFLFFIKSTTETGTVSLRGYGYRFGWWIPTAALARLLGPHETAMIAPITIASVLGIGSVYSLGKQLGGRAAAVTAALLVVVHPVDLAWSTMLANDFIASLFIALTVLAFVRAISLQDAARRRWWFAGAALWFFLAYHSKVTAVAVIPALALIAWRQRRKLWPDVAAFLVVAGLLLGSSLLASYALHGTPFAPYRGELELAGLTNADAATHRRLTPASWWQYPRFLFWHERDGEWLYAGQPHLALILAIIGGALGLAVPFEALAWFVSVFLVMQFSVVERDDLWVVAFRNIRHSHVLVYPVVVLLACYLASLRARSRRGAELLLAAVLAFGVHQSIIVASKTHESFRDQREACQYLAGDVPGDVYADTHLVVWSEITDLRSKGFTFHALPGVAADRIQEMGRIKGGYLVTGGGRDPWYGCSECIASGTEVDLHKFRLLREWPAPEEPQPWRKEALRVWIRTYRESTTQAR